MSTLTIIIAIIIAIIVGFIVYRSLSLKKANRLLSQKRFERVRTLYDKLESGQIVAQSEVYDFAKNVLTRVMTFQLLNERDLTHIFPQEFNTIEKAAESSLANWLEFPTELGTCPDEMKHIKRVTIDFDGQNNFIHYEVFKCMANEPHWAAKDGWFLGVVGPYFDDSNPYDHPYSTFCRISSKVDKISPDEEAKWVHENISKRR